MRDCVGTQGALLLTPGWAARAIVKEWVERRDVPRFGQVQLFVTESRGPVVSHAEPPKA